MTIRRKLLIVCVGLSLAITGVGSGFIAVLNHVRLGMDVAREDSLTEISQSGRLAVLANELATAMGQVLVESDWEAPAAKVDVVFGQLKQSLNRVEGAIRQQRLWTRQLTGLKATDDLVRELTQAVAVMEGLWRDLPAPGPERDEKVARLDHLSDDLVGQSLALQRRCVDSMFDGLASSSSLLQGVNFAAIATGIALLPLGLVLSVSVATQFAGRLKRIQDGAELIGRGELDTRLDDLRDDEIGHVSLSFNEMAWKLKSSLTRLEHDSVHDALTGLPNRVLFLDRINQCLARAARTGQYDFAVMFVDLDRFKLINDSLGHAAGDELLKTVSNRLASLLSATRREGSELGLSSDLPIINTVARLGGDEFTILVDGLPEGKAGQTAVSEIAAEIRALLSAPIPIAATEVIIMPSIGVALATSTYTGAAAILRDADAALYRAKADGRNRHVIFDATMHAEAVQRLRLETDLRGALDRKEFVLHYQPVTTLADSKIVGFEALLRWVHDGEIIGPAAFIPIAEETGLIVAIGEWVIECACRQLAEWNKVAEQQVSVSVNVSRRQLGDVNLLPHLSRQLRHYGIDPKLLIIELTESMFVESVEARKVVARIRELGIRIHIDDFGTGYSSLNCLNLYPADGLKIDRSFITQQSGSKNPPAVLRAIIRLAHDLGMPVVAEGIETPDQAAMLQSLGCDRGQGYLIARPMPVMQASALLENESRVGKKSA